MENVIRVKYLEGFNQLWLIGSQELRDWLRGRGCPSDGFVMERISDLVEGVESLSGSDVILGGCFTNTFRFYNRSYGSNLMVFPISEDGISYVFRDDKAYRISNRDNPRVLSPDFGSAFSTTLFFNENPFNDCEGYERVKYDVFQSPNDMDPYSIGRKKLVERAAKAGMGSSEAFIENMPGLGLGGIVELGYVEED